ncbi:zinc metallopeptidase RseP, partial [Pseudomonas syringae pv. tagetis]
QLVRRLGESGTSALKGRDHGASVDTPHELVLSDWLRGAEEPDPIKSLGIPPWRQALLPVLADIDPKGPAHGAGLKTGEP